MPQLLHPSIGYGQVDSDIFTCPNGNVCFAISHANEHRQRALYLRLTPHARGFKCIVPLRIALSVV